MASRHEGKLSPDVAQRRSGQSLDVGVAIASRALGVYGEKMKGGTEAKLDLLGPRGLYDLRRQAVHRHGAASHEIRWRNLNSVIVHIAQLADLPIGMLVMPRVSAGAPIQWHQHCSSARLRYIPAKRIIRCDVRRPRVQQHGSDL